ncbi:hypothetical protein H8959_006572 [Pygathrix nigripes]
MFVTLAKKQNHPDSSNTFQFKEAQGLCHLSKVTVNERIGSLGLCSSLPPSSWKALQARDRLGREKVQRTGQTDIQGLGPARTSDVVSEVCGRCQPAGPRPAELHQEQARGPEKQQGQLPLPLLLLLMPSYLFLILLSQD